MTLYQRSVAILVPACLVGALVAKALRPPAPFLEPLPPYSFTGDHITLIPGSRLLSRLEILQVGNAAQESTAFRTVGQIIALSNTSGNLTGNSVGWVELDPRLSESVGLHLTNAKTDRAGIAYGLTALAAEYANRIHPGQQIEIMRYGLRKSSVIGEVSKVIPREAGDKVDVVFHFSKAQDWFPGTNCEVLFPVLSGHPIRIPTTAPIHEGIQEYVWKEIGPGQFAAQNISLVDATPDDVSVLGLKPGDRIVARGAILLKPLLQPLQMSQKNR